MKQDEQWFEVLAGREPQGGDEELAAEARALRSAILQNHAKAEASPVNLAALQRLQLRLQKENLVPTRQSRTPKWLAMAAALILAVGLGLMLRQPTGMPDGSEDHPRGEQSQNSVTVPDAAQSSRQMQQDLQRLNINASLKHTGQRYWLEAYIAPERETEVNALLAPYHVVVGKDGQLLITFEAVPNK